MQPLFLSYNGCMSQNSGWSTAFGEPTRTAPKPPWNQFTEGFSAICYFGLGPLAALFLSNWLCAKYAHTTPISPILSFYSFFFLLNFLAGWPILLSAIRRYPISDELTHKLSELLPGQKQALEVHIDPYSRGVRVPYAIRKGRQLLVSERLTEILSPEQLDYVLVRAALADRVKQWGYVFGGVLAFGILAFLPPAKPWLLIAVMASIAVFALLVVCVSGRGNTERALEITRNLDAALSVARKLSTIDTGKGSGSGSGWPFERKMRVRAKKLGLVESPRL
jgi:hypothetical protein